jgi:phage terminase small subunit
VKVRKIPTPDGYGIEREIRIADKIKALELLGKRFGMFRDKVEMTGEGGGPITVVFSDKMKPPGDA